MRDFLNDLHFGVRLPVKSTIIDRSFLTLDELRHPDSDQIDGVDLVLFTFFIIMSSSQKVCILEAREVSIAKEMKIIRDLSSVSYTHLTLPTT